MKHPPIDCAALKSTRHQAKKYPTKVKSYGVISPVVITVKCKSLVHIQQTTISLPERPASVSALPRPERWAGAQERRAPQGPPGPGCRRKAGLSSGRAAASPPPGLTDEQDPGRGRAATPPPGGFGWGGEGEGERSRYRGGLHEALRPHLPCLPRDAAGCRPSPRRIPPAPAARSAGGRGGARNRP